MSNFFEPVDTNNLFDEYEITYLKFADGKYYTVKATTDSVEEREIELKQYPNINHAMDALSNVGYPKSFDRELELLLDYPDLDWDTVNNAVFLGDPDGRYIESRSEYKNARELGMEAVSDYEITLVEAIMNTAKVLLKLVEAND